MTFLAWIIVGLIAGTITSKLMDRSRSEDMYLEITLGVIGAFIGGILFTIFGTTKMTEVNVYNLVVSVIGAAVILAVYRTINQAY